MGADVMRWMYCEQAPTQGAEFGYTPAGEIKRKLLTLWNSVKFFVDYANIEQLRAARPARGADGPAAARPLARRAHRPARADTRTGTTRFWTPDVIAILRGASSTISRTGTSGARGGASGTETRRRCGRSGTRSCSAAQVIAPVMPFLTDHLWRNLRAATRPSRSSWTGWPERAASPTSSCSRRSPTCAASSRSGARRAATSGLKLRQPLRRLVVQGAQPAQGHADEIADELRVKEVEFGPRRRGAAREAEPARPRAEARQGARRRAAALQAGEFEELDGGRFRAAGHELEPDEVLVERGGGEGWAVAAADGSPSRSTTDARRRAAPRGPRLRPDPPAEHDAEGRGPRAHRPHRPHVLPEDDGDLLAPRRLDQGRGARHRDRVGRRSRSRELDEGLRRARRAMRSSPRSSFSSPTASDSRAQPGRARRSPRRARPRRGARRAAARPSARRAAGTRRRTFPRHALEPASAASARSRRALVERAALPRRTPAGR